MMRQTFRPRRTVKACTILALLLLIVSLTIQALSATAMRGDSIVSAVALPEDVSGQDVDDINRVETFVEDKRKVVVLLYERNPWAMVIGSESPSFALYDDGLVIFTRPNQDGRHEYASVVLSERERREFLASLPIAQFNNLLNEWELDLRTDQPTTLISIRDEGGVKLVRVYGNLERAMKADDPQAFIEIYRRLKSFQHARAARWMPEKVEMMIWPYESASEPLRWPKDWPDTTHPTTRSRAEVGKEGINYSIYLTPAQYERLKKEVEGKSIDALLISKRKWAFSFRFPFPDEDDWLMESFHLHEKRAALR